MCIRNPNVITSVINLQYHICTSNTTSSPSQVISMLTFSLYHQNVICTLTDKEEKKLHTGPTCLSIARGPILQQSDTSKSIPERKCQQRDEPATQ